MTDWTADDDAVLRDMWPSSLTKDIAWTLGRTRNAVIGRANRLELPTPDKATIVARIRAGREGAPQNQGRNGGKIDPWGERDDDSTAA